MSTCSPVLTLLIPNGHPGKELHQCQWGGQLPETEEALGQGPSVLNPGRPRAHALAGHTEDVSSCGQQVSISHKDTKMGISLYN